MFHQIEKDKSRTHVRNKRARRLVNPLEDALFVDACMLPTNWTDWDSLHYLLANAERYSNWH